MVKQRIYNESKAKRSETSQTILIQKLNRSLNNRTLKEVAMDKEIRAIEGAFVSVRCRVCGTTVLVKFSDWKNGKFKRICRNCNNKQVNEEYTKLYQNILPLIPDTYAINMTGGYCSITIQRKKER